MREALQSYIYIYIYVCVYIYTHTSASFRRLNAFISAIFFLEDASMSEWWVWPGGRCGSVGQQAVDEGGGDPNTS